MRTTKMGSMSGLCPINAIPIMSLSISGVTWADLSLPLHGLILMTAIPSRFITTGMKITNSLQKPFRLLTLSPG